MITTSLYADYSLNFLEKHNLKVMLGMNSESYRYNNVWGKRSDVMNDNNPDVNTSTGTQSNGAYRGEWASLGYFGRLNYDFDGRYLFEFNIRRDGSSRFQADSRWLHSHLYLSVGTLHASPSGNR